MFQTPDPSGVEAENDRRNEVRNRLARDDHNAEKHDKSHPHENQQNRSKCLDELPLNLEFGIFFFELLPAPLTPQFRLFGRELRFLLRGHSHATLLSIGEHLEALFFSLSGAHCTPYISRHANLLSAGGATNPNPIIEI